MLTLFMIMMKIISTYHGIMYRIWIFPTCKRPKYGVVLFIPMEIQHLLVLQMIHIHMAAALPNVKWIEYFMADNALLEFQSKLFAAPIAREEVTDEGVFLRAPQEPGLGLDLDPEVAGKSLVRD